MYLWLHIYLIMRSIWINESFLFDLFFNEPTHWNKSDLATLYKRKEDSRRISWLTGKLCAIQWCFCYTYYLLVSLQHGNTPPNSHTSDSKQLLKQVKNLIICTVIGMNGDLCTILAKSGIQDQTDGYARRKEEKKMLPPACVDSLP